MLIITGFKAKFGGYMKTVKLLGVICFIFIFFSCVTTAKPTEIVKAESRYYIIPEIGIQTTVYIGELLIKEGRTSAQDAIYLNNDRGSVGWTSFHPAGIYKLIGRTDGASIYQHGTIMPGMK